MSALVRRQQPPKRFGILAMFLLVLIILPFVTVVCIKTRQIQIMLMVWIVKMILWSIFVPLSPWIGFATVYAATAAIFVALDRKLSKTGSK